MRAGVAGDGDDVTGRLDNLADHVIAGVGDEQVARGVYSDTIGVVQLSGGRRPTVAAVTARTIAGVETVAGDGDDVAGRLDNLADHVVLIVGDEHVARGVHSDTIGGVQLGSGRGPVISGVIFATVACEVDDVAGRLDDLANRVVK